MGTYKGKQLVILSGVPGSGKSTFAKGFKEKRSILGHLPTEIVSSDELRYELYGSYGVDNDKEMWKIFHERVEDLINDKTTVIIVLDATFLSKKRRKAIVDRYKNKVDNISVYQFSESFKLYWERNAQRDRVVPLEAFKNMCQAFQLVDVEERQWYEEVFVDGVYMEK